MERTVLGLTLAASLFAPVAADAQSANAAACGDRQAIVERLEARWGEHFSAGGMQDASAIIEVWMSQEKGTWTILRTSADGTACVMATGTNWIDALPSEKIAGIEG